MAKGFKAAMAGMAMMTAAVVAGAAQAADFSLAAGAEVGTYFPVAGALKLLLADDKAAGGARLVPVATNGAVENLAGLQAGKYDFALAQADQVYDAFQGRGAFAKSGAITNLRSVLALHGESLALLARPGGKIKALEDLAGKKVDLGAEGSGARVLATLLTEGNKPAAKPVGLRMGEAPAALCAKKVDAAFLMVGHPSAVLLDAVTRCKNKLIPLTGAKVDALLQSNPGLEVATIPEKLYPGARQATPTVGSRAVLVARADVDPAAVGAVVKAARNNLETLRLLHPALFSLSDPAALRPASGAVPLHPAAELAFDAAAGR